MDADAWRQAKGVLAEALLHPPHEREAFVRARCPNPALRSEVQAYLNQYDEAFLESVLTVSGAFDGRSSAAENARQLPDIQPGDRVGPYVVMERLGVGGMGHVFLGNDTRLQRKVALKCLIASASAAELRSRILHEARAAARITHPNIAIVHDVIEHDDRPFLVMEYVEGESLAAVIKRAQPPLEKILAMTRQLASALSAAHATGIIHRDLKPANIQVTPDGSVKILDFGVAHAISALATATTPEAALTVSMSTSMSTSALSGDRRGMHPGTPAYMSPEQMFGRTLDQRSDIYSLGVIVYEMAAGHRPYSTDDPVEVVLALSRNFLRPDDAGSPLPVNVADVIAKMLAVRPEDRYATAADLEAAIATLTAPPPAIAVTPRSRVRVAMAMAAGVLSLPIVATLLGFLTTVWFNMLAERPDPFDNESARVWLTIGFRSLFAPAILVVGLLFALGAARFAIRLMSLSKTVDSLMTAGRTRTRRLSVKLSLDNPVVLGQAVAAFGLLSFGFVLWRSWDVLRAMSTYLSSDPNAMAALLPLRPHHNNPAQYYRLALEGLIFVFVSGAMSIVRLRNRHAVRQGASALAIVVLLLAVSLLMAELPYRMVWGNSSERVNLGGDRCYAIGESGTSLLAYCPDAPPPRNRIVPRDSPALQRLGTRENILTLKEDSH